ncbi:MAG: monooxygenase [Rhizobiales bacterium PAR1]|nr:MAG: monooxygenase [Rhizobiales bacterium PAR1]
MRPKGRGELDSLYFEYPHFDPPVRSAASGKEETPVLIVGAGPVGLVAALTLAEQGTKCIVIELKDTFNDGSRAICIARQSYYLLEKIGAIDAFLKKSLGWTMGRTFYRGQQILEFEMPNGRDDKFLPMYNLEQQYIEQFLHEAASRSPLIDIRWQSELTGLTDTASGIVAKVQDPTGAYDIAAQWLLAADGARSAVRSMRGLKLRGDNYEGRYVIADVRMNHDYPTIRRALFDPACLPGGTVLIHRQPENIWRIDYQLAPGESAEEATREETVRAKVSAILREIGHEGPWELEWWSIYSANTLLLDDYRDGRIFFIGDSAHIVPIFGVRGLNNGIADAQNIGWKLALVLAGRAGPGLLKSYTPERRGATLDVFANATKSTRFMTPPTRGWSLVRDAALSLALDHDFARPFANPRQMMPYTYADSPITAPDDPGFAAGPHPGMVAPDVALSDGTFLSDHVGNGFCCLCFAEPGRKTDDLLKTLSARHPDLRVIITGTTMTDPDGVMARRYGAQPGATYLIRPDLHVAARWTHADAEVIADALARLLDLKEAL